MLALKLLLLASDVSKQHIDVAFRGLEASHSLHIEWIEGARQSKLSDVIDSLSVAQYDRVLVWLPFKHLYSQIIALRKLPKLILFDPHFHEYSTVEAGQLEKRVKLFEALPWARFVVSGQKRQLWLKKQGADCVWLPPFVAQSMNVDRENQRSISVCFLGTPKSESLKKHREMLYEVRRELKLHIVDDDASLAEKLTVLDKSVMCFADESSFGGLRRQTLGAFSAGCVVLLWAASQAECVDLGLRDMDNVAMIDSKESLLAKVSFLNRHQDQAARIAESGQQWLKTVESQASDLLDSIIEPTLGEYKGDNAWKGLKYLFYR